MKKMDASNFGEGIAQFGLALLVLQTAGTAFLHVQIAIVWMATILVGIASQMSEVGAFGVLATLAKGKGALTKFMAHMVSKFGVKIEIPRKRLSDIKVGLEGVIKNCSGANLVNPLIDFQGCLDFLAGRVVRTITAS